MKLTWIKAFLVAQVVTLSGPAFADDFGSVVISRGEAVADIDLLEEAYERIHPGYTRYSTAEEMAAVWDGVRGQAADGITLEALTLSIQKALAQIRCDHTKIELPKTLDERFDSEPTYLPFKWTLIEERGFITGIPEGSPFQLQDEILSIDGRALSDLVAEVEPFIPTDGYTDWAKASGVGQSLEFKGGAVDLFGALMGKRPAIADVRVKHRDGTEESIAVNRMPYGPYGEIKENNETARNFKDAVTFERIGDKAAYLRIDTFVNYRNPVKPAVVYDPIFKALKDEGRNTLILDLRNNGGGSDDASGGLLKNLITKKVKATLEARVATIDHSGLDQYISTWEKRAVNPPRIAFKKNDDGTYAIRSAFEPVLKVSRPEKFAFQGQIIALTSRDNSSGSVHLLGQLKHLGRATLIGEKTGGSPNGATAGVLFTFKLPKTDIRARIPVFRYIKNVEGFADGYGLTPDIEAPLTAKAYLAGRDPALEKAMSFIEDVQ